MDFRAAFSGNPFLVFGPRPRRESRIRAYILRQHRLGRPLTEILRDPSLERLGSRSLVWNALSNRAMMDALRWDLLDEMRRLTAEVDADVTQPGLRAGR